MNRLSTCTQEITTPLRFVVTVDTEADDAWSHPDQIRLENLKQLPRFQDLCDRFGIVPTYLLTYECANRDEALSILKPLAESRHCEIGHHLHVWTCPPYQSTSGDGIDRDWIHAHQFLLPDSLFIAKSESLRHEIETNFGRSPTSHRAGRWGIDQRTVDWLVSNAFIVETSLRPTMRLPKTLGTHASTEYRLNRNPYAWHGRSQDNSDSKLVIEIPATVNVPDGLLGRSCRQWLCEGRPFDGTVTRIYRKVGGLRMLRPDPNYRPGALPQIMGNAITQGVTVINLMLHSSELALNCSRFTRSRNNLDRVWAHLSEIFEFTKRREIISQQITEVGRLVLQQLETFELR